MYKQFFDLVKEPFAMTPDPSFLFLTEAHREALAGLTYAVFSRKGFVVLTGEAGTGKTTLLTRILQSAPPAQTALSVILNPTLSAGEFLELVLLDFGFTKVPSSKAQRLMMLRQFLTEAQAAGKTAILVVDEAQRLAPQVLEEIRLLSNFERPDGKLLQIVLAGQGELAQTLNREELRQLKQRIAVRLAIRPLQGIEVEQYLRHRWSKAGTKQPLPFQSDAIERIIQYSRSIPRLINALCDNALLLAYGEGTKTITAQHIFEVARDLDLLGSSSSLNGLAAQARIEMPVAVVSPLLQNGHSSVSTFPTLDRNSREPELKAKPSRLSALLGKLGLQNS
jgi:general secretion pathway protein A